MNEKVSILIQRSLEKAREALSISCLYKGEAEKDRLLAEIIHLCEQAVDELPDSKPIPDEKDLAAEAKPSFPPTRSTCKEAVRDWRDAVGEIDIP